MSDTRTSKRERVTDLVTIFRRGRTWHVQYMHGGKQRSRTLQTSFVAEARHQALDVDHDLRKGLFRTSEDVEVGALFDRYMKYLRTEARRPNTLKRYGPIFQRFVNFCDERAVRKASHVDIVMLEDYRELRAEEDASEDALYRESVYVKMVWRYAEERSLIPVNRLKGMKLHKPRVKEQPCYTETEVESIIESAKGRERDIFTVLAFTGMRRAEMQWLTWEDVDLDGGWVHIRAKDGWLPKNKKDRKLPMHPRLREVFERLPRKHRWVFVAGPSAEYPKGGNQIHLDHLRERLMGILERIGKDRGGLHAFRRFFISYCANQGVPPTVLMKWVGHSDLRMIVRYYQLQDIESQEAMQALTAGKEFPGFKTNLRQTGVPENQSRPQLPVFQVVASAS